MICAASREGAPSSSKSSPSGALRRPRSWRSFRRNRLRLKLRHARGRRSAPDGELLLELGAPSRDAAQIMILLRERLQRHQLAAPVYAIELQLDEAVSSAGTAGQLLPDPGQA